MSAHRVDQEYQVVPIDEVRPHPDNPRRGDVDRLSVSIDRNGFYGACIVQRSTGYILAGNHRWLAAKARNLADVPVIFVDCDVDQARRIMVADNRMSDFATYDNDALGRLLSEIAAGGDLVGTGFTAEDLAKLVPDFAPEDAPEDKLDERKVHVCPACGHRWRLGADGQVEPVLDE